MQFIKSVASNTLFQIFARIVTSGSSFVIAIIIARHFGVMGYGDFAKITAFVSIFYLLSDLGFNAIFLQLENHRIKFKELLYLRLGLAVFLIIIVNLIASILPYSSYTGIGYSPFVKMGILIFSLTLITESTIYSSSVIFQKNQEYKYLLFSGVFGSLITLFLVALFSYMNLPILYILLVFVLGGVIESGSALFYTKQKIMPIKIDIEFAKKLLISTLPMGALLILNMVYFRIDMIILALFKSTQDVAYYDLAYKFFDFLIALPLFLSNVLYPGLIDDEKNKRSLERKLVLYIFYFFVFGLIVTIPVFIFAPLLYLIKQEFVNAALPLRILSLSLPIFFVTSILQWIFIAKRKLYFLISIYALMFVLNVILNLAFIPQFGYVAAATITDVLEVFVLVIFMIKLFYGKYN